MVDISPIEGRNLSSLDISASLRESNYQDNYWLLKNKAFGRMGRFSSMDFIRAMNPDKFFEFEYIDDDKRIVGVGDPSGFSLTSGVCNIEFASCPYMIHAKKRRLGHEILVFDNDNLFGGVYFLYVEDKYLGFLLLGDFVVRDDLFDVSLNLYDYFERLVSNVNLDKAVSLYFEGVEASNINIRVSSTKIMEV